MGKIIHATWKLFICHIDNYTEYNQQWNVFSAFNPSKCTHTWSSGHTHTHTHTRTHTHTHPEQWAARGAVGGSGLAQGSHLSRGQFLPETRFEPITSGYKSDGLSIRATTAPAYYSWRHRSVNCNLTNCTAQSEVHDHHVCAWHCLWIQTTQEAERSRCCHSLDSVLGYVSTTTMY